MHAIQELVEDIASLHVLASEAASAPAPDYCGQSGSVFARVSSWTPTGRPEPRGPRGSPPARHCCFSLPDPAEQTARACAESWSLFCLNVKAVGTVKCWHLSFSSLCWTVTCR